MEGDITMSDKEVNQIEIFERLKRRELKQKKAASILNLSVRQIKRKLKKYKREGASSLVHQGRGKTSNRKIDQKKLDRAIDKIREKYADFSPTLAHEHLFMDCKPKFSVERLRQEMIAEGLWQPKTKKKAKVHQLRERRACFGELVQLDGSPHDWFEGRGSVCNLNVSIDDATSNSLSLFSETETTQDYLKLVEIYLLKYGKPVAFYVDKHSVFRVNAPSNLDFKKPNKHDEFEGLTQFERAMKELEIELIFAGTPQAKGRVERVNQTLQDRLVKEMRLKNISNIKQANNFLPQFMGRFNQKFCVEPRSKIDMHRKLSPKLDLSKILCIKEKRVLSKNLTFQHKNTVFQIKTNRSAYSLRGTTVTVCERYDGSVTVLDQRDQKLDYAKIGRLPRTNPTTSKNLNHLVDAILENRRGNPWDSNPTQFEQENLFYKPAGAV